MASNDYPTPDQFPDQRAVKYGDERVDGSDTEAVLKALQDGRVDLVDVEGMTFEQRMATGLLNEDDDKARVEGRLGDHMSTSEGKARRTNVYDTKAGSDHKDRNTK